MDGQGHERSPRHALNHRSLITHPLGCVIGRTRDARVGDEYAATIPGRVVRRSTLGRVRIRRAVPDDLVAINAVHRACGRKQWEASTTEDRDDRVVAVAVVDGVIVAAGKTHLQAEPDSEAPAGHYLGGATVHPGYRRRGIGVALTRARIDWVWARVDTVYYFTDDDNTASIRLHAGFGFREIARLPAILGAQAHGESLVLFRAVRPAQFLT